MLHPAQPDAEATLFKLANTALKQARAANFPYIGTYIVASTPPPVISARTNLYQLHMNYTYYTFSLNMKL